MRGGKTHLWPSGTDDGTLKKSRADRNLNILAASWPGKVSHFSFPHFPFALILAVWNGSRNEHPVRGLAGSA
jgi:hypothetical protein